MQAVNLLHGVRLIFQEKGRDAPTKAVIILSESGASDPDQSLNWDTDRLLIKPDGFSEQDVTKIEKWDRI